MNLSNNVKQYPRSVVHTALNLPIYIYRLGWGVIVSWIPILILTTEHRTTGQPAHIVVEYRRHGSKYYIVAARGEDTSWYQNILQNSQVTIQYGSHTYDGVAHKVENPAEALRALYMFSRNSWIYETLFARMSSAESADLSTLAEVVEEFTVIRIDPTSNQAVLSPVQPFSKPIRQIAMGLVFCWVVWLMVSLLRRVVSR